MNLDVISIIIPIYNVEQYLEECLNSVLSQTYKNIEIICIDDYSTDNSANILMQYEKKILELRHFIIQKIKELVL